MWSDIKQQVDRFESAVINGRDSEGYPTSARTGVRADDARQILFVDVPNELMVQPGPASILFHDHDDKLWNQRIVLVRGELQASDEGWIFRPTQLTPLMGATSPVEMVKTIVKLRKTANTYLQKRGLARPQIPWDKLKAVKGG